ncbi:MAG: DUF2029 domain-containing protein [Anaerolineae bacterium]|nr:DUF2029 domain-containing protein [Anaerolineae bacterium]
MPYLPIPDLANRFIGPLPTVVFPHPTPHPPPVVIFALPLGLLGYQQAAVVWFVFEIVCVSVAVFMLLKWLNIALRPWPLLFGMLALFAWNPFWQELVLGQLMALLFVILLLSWQALRTHRSILGGVLLGMVVSLKLIGWPIVLFLALRRNWRASGAAIATMVVTNGIAALLIGYKAALYYYLKVGGIVGSLYQAHTGNFSLWSVGWRLFDGTGSPIILDAEAPPVLVSPLLARGISVILPLLLVIVGLGLAYRTRDFDIAFAIVVCVSVVVNPVAWIHYFILATLPLCIIGQQLLAQHFPRTETRVAMICSLLLLVSHRQWENLAVTLGAQTIIGDTAVVNPWILIILTMLPAGLIIVLMWLLYRLDCGVQVMRKEVCLS